MPRRFAELTVAELPVSWQEQWRASGERMVVRKVAAYPIGGGRAVVSAGVAGIAYASPALLSHMHLFLGVTTGAVAAGDRADVVVTGLVEDSSWQFAPGQPVFLSAVTQGVLTQVPPTLPASVFVLRIGVALSPTSLFVRPSMPMALI